MNTEIRTITVRRYGCPFCHRTASNKPRIREHLGRCWYNPANQTCKTCVHYVPDQAEPEVGWLAPEYCAADVSLLGEPCGPCDGSGRNSDGSGCSACGGYRAKPIGPITSCSLWTLREDGA